MSALDERETPPSESSPSLEPSASELAVGGRVGSWRPSPAALSVILAGLLVTAALTLTALALYNHDEDRLLKARGRELGLLLSSAVGNVQTPLASAAALADATDANRQKFDELLGPYVGKGKQFVSISLWRNGATEPLAVVGVPPALTGERAYEHSFFAGATRTPLLSVSRILSPAHPRLGYAYRVPGSRHGFFVYAEDMLPAGRHSRLQSNTAFSSLNYALYLGTRARRSDLLVTNLSKLPATGRRASDLVPFANTHLLLIVTAIGSLAGSFFHDLPVIIAIVGLLLATLAAVLTDRLANRRRRAEELAALLDEVAEENRKLYTEQRSIAQQLQHALLPDTIPAFDGLDVSARYVPGISGIDVGGDWYDLLEAGPGLVILVVGDVSGRGLHAATTMAFLRNSIIAFASQPGDPAIVLSKLSRLVSGREHDYFATVLCALVDIEAHEMTLVSAGHLQPLVIEDGKARFAEIPVGAPIGATSDSEYRQATIPLAPGATFIAFTDGLVERRGETLDVGLERLRAAAGADDLPLEQLVSNVLEELSHADGHDDTAILAVRWQD